MSLETRITALASAVGADIKALAAQGAAPRLFATTLSVVPARFGQAVVNVVDANVTPTTSVMPTLAPNADWDADDLADLTVTAQASIGSIDFCIARLGPIVGDFKIIYQLG